MQPPQSAGFTPPFLLNKHFDPTPGQQTTNTDSFWFIFHDDDLCLLVGDDDRAIAVSNRCPVTLTNAATATEHIGTYDGIPCVAVQLHTPPPENRFERITLRQSHTRLDGDLWVIAGRALQILQWKRDNKYCGRCGKRMARADNELVMKCTSCTFSSYPRLSPAVIMSVTRGNNILLGRSPRFPEGMYSTLAGFVEPGETLEEAVRREVREETSVEVGNIRYVASQPWPFPHSLMVGFTAEYLSGDIQVDNRELEDARWFSAENMPRLPFRLSIARLLIDQFLERCQPATPH